jgi:HAD superfamily hydrolase (TIGR01490 family)
MKNTQANYYVFFDVDGTLIKGKPMLDYLKFYYQKRFYPWKLIGKLNYFKFLIKSKIQLYVGRDRETINKTYYNCYKGQDINWLKEIGQEWFIRNIDNKKAYIKNILHDLIEHQQAGAEIVLVSGSFAACLEPFAKKFDIQHILATQLEEKDNKLTGMVLHQQTIGEGKKYAILNFLQTKNFKDYHLCYAYGDHLSDIPMLSLVGYPKVVGGDSILEAYANDQHWEILIPLF